MSKIVRKIENNSEYYSRLNLEPCCEFTKVTSPFFNDKGYNSEFNPHADFFEKTNPYKSLCLSRFTESNFFETNFKRLLFYCPMNSGNSKVKEIERKHINLMFKEIPEFISSTYSLEPTTYDVECGVIQLIFEFFTLKESDISKTLDKYLKDMLIELKPHIEAYNNQVRFIMQQEKCTIMTAQLCLNESLKNRFV